MCSAFFLTLKITGELGGRRVRNTYYILKLHWILIVKTFFLNSIPWIVYENNSKFCQLTLGEETFKYTMVGAKEVLANCDGWLMVSQSKTTSCKLSSVHIMSINCVIVKQYYNKLRNL